jgi:hypothetical protein
MFSAAAFRRSLAARAPMKSPSYQGGLSPRDRLIREVKERQRKGMLQDPATYPLMAIVGSALTFATGFMIWYSQSHADVRLNRKERQKLMRELSKQDKIMRLDDPFGKT